MKKIRQFTPELLEKWERSGRGKGTFGDYSPWHQITRSDPSSRGRSHHLYCPLTERHHHLLSDGEKMLFGFALMVPGIIDAREQYMLSTHSHLSAISDYLGVHYFNARHPFLQQGTVEVASQLGIKHPWEEKDGLWRLSTDLLITIVDDEHCYELLALAYKSREVLTQRQRELLKIEREYWLLEGVRWQLITPDIFNPLIGDTVSRVLPWVLHPSHQFTSNDRSECAYLVNNKDGMPLADVIDFISDRFSINKTATQALFWQTIWAGQIPLDLCRDHFVRTPIHLLSENEFAKQNPVISRRSAWL